MFAFGDNHDGPLDVRDKEEGLLLTLLRGELKNKPVLQAAASPYAQRVRDCRWSGVCVRTNKGAAGC